MSEKRCPRCAEHIKADAKLCRHCNYEFSDSELVATKAKLTRGRWLIVLSMTGLVLTVGTCMKQSPPAARSTASQAADAAPAALPPLEVTSRALASAYAANEVAAQEQYGSQPVLLTGVVSGITLDYADHPVVQLAGVNQFLPVQARLNAANQAASLSKGDRVRILCSSISEVISAPMLSDCDII